RCSTCCLCTSLHTVEELWHLRRFLPSLYRHETNHLEQSPYLDELDGRQRDGLDPKLGRGDILLIQLAFCHRCRTATCLEQTGVAQYDEGSINRILWPAIGRPTEVSADLRTPLAAPHISEKSVANGMRLWVTCVPDRCEGIPIASPGPLNDFVPVRRIGLMESREEAVQACLARLLHLFPE